MPSFDSDHAYRSLPRSPDLGHLRDEAKSLKKSCVLGDRRAIAFVDFHRGHATNAVKLTAMHALIATTVLAGERMC